MTAEEILKTIKIIDLHDDYIYEYGFTCRSPSINRAPDYSVYKNKMQLIKERAEKVDKAITERVFKMHYSQAQKYKKELMGMI